MESFHIPHSRLHIVFLPLMASGHIIPMLDIVNLFAQREVRCTVVTTATYTNVVNLAIKNTPSVDLRLVSLPPTIHSTAGQAEFLFSLHHLRPSVEAILPELCPTALVADMFFPWATALCGELGLPRLLFTGTCTFTRCAMASIHRQNIHEVPLRRDESTDDQAVEFHDLPNRIQLFKTQIPGPDTMPPQLATLLKEVKEAEEGCYGEIINSFYELEPDYVRHSKEVLGRRVWLIGPVSLCNSHSGDLSTRGADEVFPSNSRCQEWLDSKPAGSVLYICFGSSMRISATQLQEISTCLEATQQPFLWVVRDKSADGTSLPWLPKAIEKKEAAGDCLIVRDWAPQVLILNHASIGGFLTHCGWNSSLESIAAGVPMATWPLFAEQFYNERLLVDVLKVGVPIGSKHYSLDGDRRPVIAAADIETAIKRLMGDTDEAEARRQRAKELAAAARKAVLEGGSSFADIDSLINQLQSEMCRTPTGKRREKATVTRVP